MNMEHSVRIDYWDVVTRSLRITWRHKFLWFFGFFAASGPGVLNWNRHGPVGVRDFFVAHAEILAAVILLALLLALVLFVVGLISKGALISSIARIQRKEGASFELGVRGGLRAFWGLLVIRVIEVLALLVVTFVCGVAVITPLAAGSSGIALAIVMGAILFVPYVAFLFALTFVVIFAERNYVIHRTTIGQALVLAMRLTRAHVGKALLVWLVALLSGLIFTVGLAIVLLLVAIPFVLIALQSELLALALGIPVGILIVVLASAAFTTYGHALWSLLYMDLTGASGPTAEALSETGPEDPIVGQYT
jgi:hypothetical protein